MTKTLVGLSGSLRRESFNSRLLQAAQRLCPDDTTLEIQSIDSIPLYNFDVETDQGIPDAVTNLKDAIAAADGLLIASPEYNNSVPGVLKNTIDWLSRPPGDIPRVFGSRPVAIFGATPGGFGTVLAQNAWLPIMRTLGTCLWAGGRLLVPHAAQLFDDAARKGVREKVSGLFIDSIHEMKQSRHRFYDGWSSSQEPIPRLITQLPNMPGPFCLHAAPGLLDTGECW